jgi:cobalt/nickel transport system permease protein
VTLAVRPDAVRPSPVARWDARWKLAGVLWLAAVTATLSHLDAAAGGFATAVALCLVARLSAADVAGRLGLLAVSSAPLLLLLPLTADRTAAGVFALKLGSAGLLALVLARTATVGRTFAAAGSLGLPTAVVQVGWLAHRFTQVFAAEVKRVRLAWRLRGFRMTTGRHAYRTVGQSVGAVLVRADDRAERVTAALRTRGFTGDVPQLQPFHTSPGDVAGFLACVVAGVLLVWADRG